MDPRSEMQRYMTLMEEASSPKIEVEKHIEDESTVDVDLGDQEIDESFGSWLADKMNAGKDRFLAGLGNRLASGKVDARNLSQTMLKNFRIWLGQIGEPADESTLAQYLAGVGFPAPAIKSTFDRMGLELPGTGAATESTMNFDIYDSYISEDLGLSDLSTFFTNAANVAYKSGIIGRNGRINPSNYRDDSRYNRDAQPASSASGDRVEPTLNTPKAEPTPEPVKEPEQTKDEGPVQGQSVDQVTKQMLKYLKNGGITPSDIEDLRHGVMSVRGIKDIADPAEQKMLAAVGFAFMKARSGG